MALVIRMDSIVKHRLVNNAYLETQIAEPGEELEPLAIRAALVKSSCLPQKGGLEESRSHRYRILVTERRLKPPWFLRA